MEINEVLEVTAENHETLGRVILVKCKRDEDGKIPFHVDCSEVDVNEEAEAVTIRLTELTAIKLAHCLTQFAVGQPVFINPDQDE